LFPSELNSTIQKIKNNRLFSLLAFSMPFPQNIFMMMTELMLINAFVVDDDDDD